MPLHFVYIIDGTEVVDTEPAVTTHFDSGFGAGVRAFKAFDDSKSVIRLDAQSPCAACAMGTESFWPSWHSERQAYIVAGILNKHANRCANQDVVASFILACTQMCTS